MTTQAPTPSKVDAPYDIELEQSMDDERLAKCPCGKPAAWISTIHPCTHQFTLCDEHEAIGSRVWAEALADEDSEASCARCNAAATGRNVRPI